MDHWIPRSSGADGMAESWTSAAGEGPTIADGLTIRRLVVQQSSQWRCRTTVSRARPNQPLLDAPRLGPNQIVHRDQRQHQSLTHHLPARISICGVLSRLGGWEMRVCTQLQRAITCNALLSAAKAKSASVHQRSAAVVATAWPVAAVQSVQNYHSSCAALQLILPQRTKAGSRG